MQNGATPLPLVLVRANWQAQPLVAILSKLPLLSAVSEVRMVDETGSLDEILAEHEPGRLAAICDQVRDYWLPERWRVPAHWPDEVGLIRFPLVECKCLWPLAGSDPRNRAEPFCPSGRYPFSDHTAAALADCDGDDDAIYRRYLDASSAALPDMEAALIADVAAMAARDAYCDVRFTVFFTAEFQRQRLFNAALAPAGAACTELAARLAYRLAPRLGLDPAMTDAAVRRFTRGMIGIAHEQHPIHPLVAERLGLHWYDAQMLFRSFKTSWTFRDSMVRAVRWSHWVP